MVGGPDVASDKCNIQTGGDEAFIVNNHLKGLNRTADFDLK